MSLKSLRLKTSPKSPVSPKKLNSRDLAGMVASPPMLLSTLPVSRGCCISICSTNLSPIGAKIRIILGNTKNLRKKFYNGMTDVLLTVNPRFTVSKPGVYRKQSNQP